MSKQQGNDFSKIQARFANRLKLTSADVDEVIRKRLLPRTTWAAASRRDLCRAAQQLQDPVRFRRWLATYRNFRDEEHSSRLPVHPLPVRPLPVGHPESVAAQRLRGQAQLGGRALHAGCLPAVAIHIADHSVGQLATFDLMFEGIRTALKRRSSGSILTAEHHLDDAFAVRLLKALFLVKYVKEFKATPRNLTVLMLDRFDADLPALRKQVEEALNLLEQQTYIQRNGDLYEYLTDEEKDVEQEIKNTEVETMRRRRAGKDRLRLACQGSQDPLRRTARITLLAQAGRPAPWPRERAGHPHHQPVPRTRRQRDDLAALSPWAGTNCW